LAKPRKKDSRTSFSKCPFKKTLEETYWYTANECELDKIGRILIPLSHRNHANLNKKVILSGQGHSFEIWDENIWAEQIEKLERLSTQVETPQEIQKLSL
jgi:MraZ protein